MLQLKFINHSSIPDREYYLLHRAKSFQNDNPRGLGPVIAHRDQRCSFPEGFPKTKFHFHRLFGMILHTYNNLKQYC